MEVGLRDRRQNTVLTLDAREGMVTIRTGHGSPLARVDDLDSLVAAFMNLPARDTFLVPVVKERPRVRAPIDAVLLLALAVRWPCIVVSDNSRRPEPLHLTLAHALPLALDEGWRTWAAEHAELLIRGDQLVAVPASDLVVVANAGDERRHRRLLRRHSETTVVEHDDVEDFLGWWSNFGGWRYGRSPSREEVASLLGVVQMSGCVVREFVHCGEVVARSLICVHESSRTVFDLMATWHPRHARLRPGIFAGVYNLNDACRQGFRFSLCYGQFPYKDAIVGGGRRLALQDLLRHEGDDRKPWV